MSSAALRSAISIEALSYRYPTGQRPALAEISLEIGQGEFVVVAGSSGSGKSSLLRAVAGLVPHFHGGEISGRVMVEGMDTRDHGPGALAAVVGTLVQDPETQIVLGTVRADLAFPVENHGWPAAAVARAVEETALALAIDQLLDRSTADLSGGELQRVALGATLTARPAIICLDEPTSQLDPVAGDELISALRRLNEEFDVTVVLSEHRLERCLSSADRVLALDRGRLAFDGTPNSFLSWAHANAPSLATPGATLLSDIGLRPVAGVKGARAALRGAGYQLASSPGAPASAGGRAPTSERRAPKRRETPALRFDRVWHELRDGPAILRGLSLEVMPAERVAVMGRNGAGKSTMLRHAAGLMAATRGKVQADGRVALVLQNPTDYLVHERVDQEAPAAALERFGLGDLADRHPRDLSGGEKQRLALAIVLAEREGVDVPAVVCLDEPTRGMDRAAKLDLVGLLQALGSAVVVATHDPEFAAALADRVVLLAAGRVIADGPVQEILAGGTYFTTESARIVSGALMPSDAVATLSAPAIARDHAPDPDAEPNRTDPGPRTGAIQ